MKSPFLYYLAILFLFLALPVQADFNYGSEPLFLSKGVQPNVMMMVDNSASMVDSASHDTGTNYPYLDICNNNTSVAQPAIYAAITRYEAAMQAACRMVLDNASAMRIGFSTFDGEGESKHDIDVATPNTTNNSLSIKSPVGSSSITLLTSIYSTGIDGIDGVTPLHSAMYALSRAYRGKTYKDSGSTLSSTSPIQYRCQKNYLLYFTDGTPNDSGDWGDSTPVMLIGDPVNNSPWNAISGSSPSWTGGLPNWDGYSDYWNGGDADGEIAWMDDIAQMLYDTDLQVDGAAAYGVACPVGSENSSTSATEDCSGESWDEPDAPVQNVVTYTIGFGSEANNEMMRDTPLLNRIPLDPSMVDAVADTIAIESHDFATGDYVHYYAAYVDQDHNATVTANTGTDVLSGNTLNMVTGDALAYNNGGGAQLQYQVITTPAVPAANCGSIGGLTSGSNYYVAYRSATELRLATTSANAYLSAALADAALAVSNYTIDLTSTGTLNTTHAFTRTNASAGFISTGAGSSPVDITANIEKITRAGHGLNTGDQVTYSCTGTSCAIAPLINGNTYYVAYRSADEFRLSTTAILANNCAAANDGNATVGTSCINLTGRGGNGGVQTFTKAATATATSFTATGVGIVPVRTTSDYEKITATSNHGFSTGDRVTYTCSNFSGTPAVYTSYDLPATVYARTVVAGNPGTFQLSLTSGGSALDISNAGNIAQNFSWINATQQSLIGGLYPYVTDAPPDDTPDPASEDSAKGKYYAKSVSDDAIQLYGAIRDGRSPFEQIQGTFAGTNASTSSTDRRITVNDHAFLTGDAVVYTCPNGCTAGLTDGSTYYVGRVDNTRIRLATTFASAAGCATGYANCVAFTGTDPDSQFLTYTPPTPAAVNLVSSGYGVLSAGPGKSHFVSSAAELTEAMEDVFNDIYLESSARESVWRISAQILNNTQAYNTRFNDKDWSGDVQANPVDTGTGAQTEPAIWKASEQLPAYSVRNIVTRSDTYGARDFTTANWSSLTSTQQTALSNGVSTLVGQNVLNWIRGQEVSGYRARTQGMLGDFLGSVPAYIAAPDRNYENTLPLGVEQSTYGAFKASQTNRTPMIYAGANDGMLHGFNANTGTELFAFIPEAAYMDWNDTDNDGVKDVFETAINKFYQLSQPYYGKDIAQPHQYFVDGTPATGDAFFTTSKASLPANSWHTVLVGGLGKGGRSVYALDITDNSFNKDDVLWEFDDNNSGDMGYSYSQPQIARLSTGQWVAIFGNGYDSRSDQARLYIVNLENGSLIQEITLGVVGNNGLSSVAVRNDATDTALAVYAGDLQGNIWKIDISNGASLPSSVITPFFVAQDGVGNKQAITASITLGENPEGGVMLYVGTGTYFREEDRAYTYPMLGPQYDAIYGIWDKEDVNSVAIYDLVEQQMGTIALDPDGDDVFEDFRSATANDVDYAGGAPDRGWFMKLAVTQPVSVYQGERVVSQPMLGDTGLVFTTVIPAANDPCINNGDGMTLVLEPLSGSQLMNAVIDTNDDDVIDANDVPVAGFENNGDFLIIQDNDGVTVGMDNCPAMDNPDQLNTDNDSLGDACDSYPSNAAVSSDNDNDGAPEAWDAFCDVSCQESSGLSLDNCPFNNNTDQLDTDSDTQGDACDSDDDSDGVMDTLDKFPLQIAVSADTDADGYANSWNAACDPSCQTASGLTLDNCPTTSNNTQADFDGDAQGDACDTDDDDDGVPDSTDAFDFDPAESVDTDNDGLGNNADTDDDNDTILDGVDNCALNSNLDQLDGDGDGIGDACDNDFDNDGVINGSDGFPLNAAASSDVDGDGFPGSWNAACDIACQQASGLMLDNCPSAANASQLNNDGDTQGDVCDTDDDNDGILDATDNCPLINNADQLDSDFDLQGDVCDAEPFVAPAGFLDLSFNPGTGANSTVYTSAVQADGKIVIGGTFTTVNGVSLNRIARLNADGSVDSSFNPGTGASSTVYTIAVQVDGKIIVGGYFTTVNGVARNYIARLNADGSLDSGFTSGTGAGSIVHTSAVQADGKIIIGGAFSTVNGIARNDIVRLNADGSVDNSFNPGTGANTAVFASAVQADGKIIIGGDFTTVNGVSLNRIARLNADGSVDNSFNPGTGVNNYVRTIALQADGKIIIGGEFISVNGVARNYIARLNADGSVDSGFNPGTGANGYVRTSVVQADGKIIIGGEFTTVNGVARNNIARLDTDGSVDSSFNPGTGASNTVYTSAPQADGKIIIGGDFTSVKGVVRNRIARIHTGDSDSDGIQDAADKFPLNAAASSDTDNDGFPGSWNIACDLACQQASGLVLDNCPSNANADQLNTDGDAEGDVCDADDDNDGLTDSQEATLGTNPLLVDTDGDGVSDSMDVFPLDIAESVDTDNDSIGNNADWDDDNDGVPDTVDAAPLDAGDTSEIILPLDGAYKGGALKNDRLAQ